jgi:hypothetical protein
MVWSIIGISSFDISKDALFYAMTIANDTEKGEEGDQPGSSREQDS